MNDPLKRLDELAALQQNWDSYNARPIRKSIIAEVRSLLQTLPQQCASIGATYKHPFIAPLSNGGLQVEWHYSGKDIEVEYSLKKKGVEVEMSFVDGMGECDMRVHKDDTAVLISTYLL